MRTAPPIRTADVGGGRRIAFQTLADADGRPVFFPVSASDRGNQMGGSESRALPFDMCAFYMS